jgi:hypothetical protein
MPRGGKRPGAGRKKGSRTRRTQAVAAVALAEGVSPLEVMLASMRVEYAGGNLKAAAALARDAAPYCHPRLASVQHKGSEAEPVRLVEEIVIVDAHPDASAAPPSGAGPLSD